MNYYAILPLATFFLSVAIGLYVINRKSEDRMNRLFLIFSFAISSWALSDFFIFNSNTPTEAYIWDILRVTSAMITFSVLFCFISAFTRQKFLSKKVFFILYMPAALIIIIRFATNLIVQKMTRVYWGFVAIPGSLYPFPSAYVLLLIISSLYLIYNFYSNTKSENEKKQSEIILIGLVLLFSATIISEAVLPIFGINIMPLTTSLALILDISIIYAIKKRGLFSSSQISIRNKLIASLLIISIIPLIITIGIGYNYSNNAINEYVQANLDSALENKINWIELYLDERKEDIAFLSMSPSIRLAFSEKAGKEAQRAKNEIRDIAKNVSKEVSGYIKSHKNMTLSDLQNDDEFEKIAVQHVGKNGYTALTDYNTLICRFHKNPAIVNMDLHLFSEKLPGFWSIMSKTKGGHDADGFYYWKESDGRKEEKYMYISIVNETTKDGIGLSVAATTYIKDYGSGFSLLDETKKYLKNFKKDLYDNIYLILPDGRVWWTTNENISLGGYLNKYSYEGKEISKAFKKAANSKKTFISDYEHGTDGDKNVFYISKRISDEDIFHGVLIMEVNSDRINFILEDHTGLGNTGETVMISRNEYRMLSNSRFSNKSTMLENKTFANNTIKCFNEKPVMQNFSLQKTKDYRKIDTFSVHKLIPGTNWCIIAKMDQSEAMQTQNNMLVLYCEELTIVLIIVIIASILITKNVVDPIKRITSDICDISKGRMDVKVTDKERMDEIGSLAQAFDRTLVSLKLAMKMSAPELKRESDELKRTLSEKEDIQERLFESEEKFKSIGESAHDAIIMIDNEGKTTYWNNAAENIFGYKKEEIIGKNLHAIIAPKKYIEAYKKAFTIFRNTGKGAAVGKTVTLSSKRKNGTEFQVELSLSSVKINGKWNAIGIIRDVTKRVESEKKYRDIFELSPEAIVILDKKGKFIDANDRLHDWLGYSKDDVIGKNLIDMPFITKKGKMIVMKNFAKRMMGKDIAPYKLDFISNDGKRHVGRIVATSIKDGNGKITADLVMITDITDDEKIKK